jgi:hypothetical protein
MKNRVALLLALGLLACACNRSAVLTAPALTPTSERAIPAATPTADPSRLLFIEFFGIY